MLFLSVVRRAQGQYMSIFADIPKKIADWVGVPALIAAFVLSLAIWLYYDLVLEMTLNNTMSFGLGLCSLLIMVAIKVIFGLFKHSTKPVEEEKHEE